MLSTLRRDCGQVSTCPSGVLDQSMERMSAPIAPPPGNTPLIGVMYHFRMPPWLPTPTAISRRRALPGDSVPHVAIEAATSQVTSSGRVFPRL